MSGPARWDRPERAGSRCRSGRRRRTWRRERAAAPERGEPFGVDTVDGQLTATACHARRRTQPASARKRTGKSLEKVGGLTAGHALEDDALPTKEWIIRISLGSGSGAVASSEDGSVQGHR